MGILLLFLMMIFIFLALEFHSHRREKKMKQINLAIQERSTWMKKKNEYMIKNKKRYSYLSRYENNVVHAEYKFINKQEKID